MSNSISLPLLNISSKILIFYDLCKEINMFMVNHRSSGAEFPEEGLTAILITFGNMWSAQNNIPLEFKSIQNSSTLERESGADLLINDTETGRNILIQAKNIKISPGNSQRGPYYYYDIEAIQVSRLLNYQGNFDCIYLFYNGNGVLQNMESSAITFMPVNNIVAYAHQNGYFSQNNIHIPIDSAVAFGMKSVTDLFF